MNSMYSLIVTNAFQCFPNFLRNRKNRCENIIKATRKIREYNMESWSKKYEIRNGPFVIKNFQKKNWKNSYGFWKIKEFIWNVLLDCIL